MPLLKRLYVDEIFPKAAVQEKKATGKNIQAPHQFPQKCHTIGQG